MFATKVTPITTRQIDIFKNIFCILSFAYLNYLNFKFLKIILKIILLLLVNKVSSRIILINQCVKLSEFVEGKNYLLLNCSTC